MKTYREQLREREARVRTEPRVPLSKQEYAALKSALTRAKNSGDGHKILEAVERAVARFNDTIWPDDWPTWRIALQDAAQDNRETGLGDELHAASLILFDW